MTTDGTRNPAEDSGGDESASADDTGGSEGERQSEGSTTPDVGSTISTKQPLATTTQLKTLRAEAEDAASKDPVRDILATGGRSCYQRAPELKST